MVPWQWDGREWRRMPLIRYVYADGTRVELQCVGTTFNAGFVKWTKRNRPRKPGPSLRLYGLALSKMCSTGIAKGMSNAKLFDAMLSVGHPVDLPAASER